MKRRLITKLTNKQIKQTLKTSNIAFMEDDEKMTIEKGSSVDRFKEGEIAYVCNENGYQVSSIRLKDLKDMLIKGSARIEDK